MFPDNPDNINDYPTAQYGVRLVFDYMTIFTVIELARDAEEEADEDEDSLTERVITEACNQLNDHYGVDFQSFRIRDVELTLEAVSV